MRRRRRSVTADRGAAGQESAAVEPGHRRECAQPRSQGCKCDVHGVFGIADHGKRRQHVPDRAPVRGPDATAAGHRRVEEHIGRVGGRGGGKDADRDQRIDGESSCDVSVGKGFTQTISRTPHQSDAAEPRAPSSQKANGPMTPRPHDQTAGAAASRMPSGPAHLIASGLIGEPTAPVIGIAGATNMNS